MSPGFCFWVVVKINTESGGSRGLSTPSLPIIELFQAASLSGRRPELYQPGATPQGPSHARRHRAEGPINMRSGLGEPFRVILVSTNGGI